MAVVMSSCTDKSLEGGWNTGLKKNSQVHLPKQVAMSHVKVGLVKNNKTERLLVRCIKNGGKCVAMVDKKLRQQEDKVGVGARAWGFMVESKELLVERLIVLPQLIDVEGPDAAAALIGTLKFDQYVGRECEQRDEY